VFVLRAGKALAARRRGVLVLFRDGRRRWIDVDQADVARDESEATADSEATAAGFEQAAYTEVLRNVLDGGSRLSIQGREAELAWRIVTPILSGWAAGAVPLATYPAGTTPAPMIQSSPV
jgi:glucose-6-phosphate 1-dehydrogenase